MQMAHIYINKEIGKEIEIHIWSSEHVGVYLSIENLKRLLSPEKNGNITSEIQSKILHVRDM